MHSDIFPAHHYSNWETVLILEELSGDMDIKTEESEPLEKKRKYEVSVFFNSSLESKLFSMSWTVLICTKQYKICVTSMIFKFISSDLQLSQIFLIILDFILRTVLFPK